MTYTEQKKQASAVVPRLTPVEITLYDHEIYADQKLIARITYDDNDFVTECWVVVVNGEEVLRRHSWQRCFDDISWHYRQGTLPVQEEETPATTTGNEITVQIAAECKQHGLELLDDGIYSNDRKLGSAGCTNSRWWVKRASSEQQKVPCDSAKEAVRSLLMVEALPPSCEQLMDQAFDELTEDEWQRLRSYQPASERRLVAV
ncbi:hypothetical protein NIES4074_62620 (plasmid) [Cylindrospermum sp. NIES-4074]|nr:hypothetical protein NIES4074_62620 [Cylindrospermum sp. NIES-4074]